MGLDSTAAQLRSSWREINEAWADAKARQVHDEVIQPLDKAISRLASLGAATESTISSAEASL